MLTVWLLETTRWSLILFECLIDNGLNIVMVRVLWNTDTHTNQVHQWQMKFACTIPKITVFIYYYELKENDIYIISTKRGFLTTALNIDTKFSFKVPPQTGFFYTCMKSWAFFFVLIIRTFFEVVAYFQYLSRRKKMEYSSHTKMKCTNKIYSCGIMKQIILYENTHYVSRKIF